MAATGEMRFAPLSEASPVCPGEQAGSRAGCAASCFMSASNKYVGIWTCRVPVPVPVAATVTAAVGGTFVVAQGQHHTTTHTAAAAQQHSQQHTLPLTLSYTHVHSINHKADKQTSEF